ncbi:hypothetical protein [Paenibacillus sp. NRS-1760]|uniref:hypothetical protein n=1 Tax=Paenibacillus sp. NRS-1760 TaxID=3233902 RepID=UPI003D297948
MHSRLDEVTKQAAQIPPDQIEQYLPPPLTGVPHLWDSDDDEIHILVHNTFRKSIRYREMPPEMRMLVDRHYQEQVDRMNASALAQQQA